MKARSSLGSELLLNYSSLGWSRAWGIWKTHTHCMRGHGGKENKKRIRTEIRVEGEWLYCYVRVQFEEGESKIRPGEVTKHQEERNWLMCPLTGELLSHCLVKKPLFIYIFFYLGVSGCILNLNACFFFLHMLPLYVCFLYFPTECLWNIYPFCRIQIQWKLLQDFGSCYCMIQATNLNWKGSCLLECLGTMCFKKLNTLL